MGTHTGVGCGQMSQRLPPLGPSPSWPPNQTLRKRGTKHRAWSVCWVSASASSSIAQWTHSARTTIHGTLQERRNVSQLVIVKVDGMGMISETRGAGIQATVTIGSKRCCSTRSHGVLACTHCWVATELFRACLPAALGDAIDAAAKLRDVRCAAAGDRDGGGFVILAEPLMACAWPACGVGKGCDWSWAGLRMAQL